MPDADHPTSPSAGPLWGGDPTSQAARDDVVDGFCVGEDRELDRRLLVFDCRGSRAHVLGLQAAGVLTSDEAARLTDALHAIEADAAAGRMPIEPQHEDGHTAIEDRLTRELGDLGKKVHTARSRNDQVLTALRLFTRDRLATILRDAEGLEQAFRGLAERAGETIMPGYTHGQPAMPLPVATWAGSFADGVADDRRMLQAVAEMVDQSPLGSAAGFGSPIPLDRQATSDALGFRAVQANPVYCQQSRLKFDAAVVGSLAQLAWTIAQFASDGLLFVSRAYQFLRLPTGLTTGSSLMPNKRNPDVLELLRALHPEIEGYAATIRALGLRLGSGYHRDVQAAKRPYLDALDRMAHGVSAAARVVARVEVDPAAIERAMTPELYATEAAHKLVVEQGIPFRDAYKQVKQQVMTSRDQETAGE